VDGSLGEGGGIQVEEDSAWELWVTIKSADICKSLHTVLATIEAQRDFIWTNRQSVSKCIEKWH
jgi:hypothetical protein